MIYLISSLLLFSIMRNYRAEIDKWDVQSQKDRAEAMLSVLQEEHQKLQKMYDDLSDEYRDFVDFVNEEEIRLQNEMGEKLIKSLQDEIMTQALLSMKPNAEA